MVRWWTSRIFLSRLLRLLSIIQSRSWSHEKLSQLQPPPLLSPSFQIGPTHHLTPLLNSANKLYCHRKGVQQRIIARTVVLICRLDYTFKIHFCWAIQLHSMQYIWCDRVLYGARCLQISIVDDVIISNGVLMPYWPQVTGKVAAGNIVKVLVLKMSIVFATGCDVLW